MKHLSDYTQEGITNVMNKYGAFFAFSKSQFEAAKVEGLQYESLSSGMIVPVGKGKAVIEEINAVGDAGIAQDIAENGLEAIIKRELYNHECFYTGDWKEAAFQGAFEGYDISEEDVHKVYRAEYAHAMESL